MDNSSGAFGEDYAARFLINKGYGIIERNYRSRFGEIDIIAKDDRYILFVEIKTRDKRNLVSPFEAVTRSKQKKIIKTALLYLQRHPCGLQPRFDVIGILTENGGSSVLSVSHLENAFESKGFL